MCMFGGKSGPSATQINQQKQAAAQQEALLQEQYSAQQKQLAIQQKATQAATAEQELQADQLEYSRMSELERQKQMQAKTTIAAKKAQDIMLNTKTRGRAGLKITPMTLETAMGVNVAYQPLGTTSGGTGALNIQPV